MKFSISLIAAVSVNLVAAAIHSGSHPRYGRVSESWEEQGMSLALATASDTELGSAVTAGTVIAAGEHSAAVSGFAAAARAPGKR